MLRFLFVFCFCLVLPVFAQDAPSLGESSVSAVTSQYVMNTHALLPDTHKPLPSTGRWSVKAARPESCPQDDTPCARVVYRVAEEHVVCEWTVVPQQGSAPAVFLDQNEDASHYLLRKLGAGELAGLVLTSPEPMYPPIARAAHVTGSVVMRFVVSSDGSVTSVSRLSGPPMLAGAAEDAAKHWTFRALYVGTQAAPFVADVSAHFRLETNGPGTPGGKVEADFPRGVVSMRP